MLRALALSAAFSIVPAGAAFAQTLVTGDIAGHVTDATGAAVANATVSLKSLQDGSSQVVKTDKSGAYRFPLLRPGSYAVHEEGAGMSADAPTVAVNVGQATDLELVAKPNGSTTTVEVSTNEPLLQNQDGNISTTFSTAQIDNLPIPGGDISNLPFSTPGASVSTGEGYGNFTVFGLPSTSNLFTTNGADLMDAYLNLPNSGASNNVLGANELSEAAVVVNGYTGQYGRLAGAQVNFTTKSGTNNFHGNAILDYNSSGLNANDWFLKQQQVAPNSGLINAQPHAVSRQWGGSIGGPLWKDKLFAFFDDEGLRYVLPGGGSTTYVPTTAFQTAVLSNIAAKQPAELAFYKNIFSLYTAANGFSTAVPDNLAGDAGGCGDFDQTTVGGVTFGEGATPCAASFVPNNNSLNTEQLYSVRIDANLTSKDQVNARFKHDWGVQATSTDPINNAFSANSVQPEYEGQLNETHVFGPHVTNSFTIASLYYSAVFGPPNFGAATATFPTTFNFNDGDGFVSLGGSDSSYPSGRNVSQYQVADDVSIVKNKNSFKVGYNFRRYNITNFAPLAGSTGATTFGSNTDFFNGIISASHSSASTTTLATSAIAQAHLALYSIGVYVQDQFAATRNFNLTASLRFDRGSNPKCGNNCFVRTTAPFDQVAHTASIPYNQTISTGNANAFNDVEKVTIQPRIGFAFTPFGPNGNTVIRGGGGLFADLPVASVLTRFITSAPNYVSFTVNPGGANPTYTVQPGLAGSAYAAAKASGAAFEKAFASGGTLASIQTAVAAAGSTYATPNYTASATNKLLNPKFAEYNLEVQQAISRHDVFDINYVGNIGTDILFINPTANANAYCAQGGNPNNLGFGNGFCPSNSFGDLPIAAIDTRFKAVSILTNNGHSNYNGITVSYRHQSTFGLTTAVNYTYSHSLDNTSNGGVEGFNAGSEASYITSQIDPGSVDKYNYGNSDYDTRHGLTANYTWAIPAKFNNRIMQSVLGGYVISGTVFAKSGIPYSVIRGSLATGITNGTNGGLALGGFLGGPRASCGNPRANCLTTSQFIQARPTPPSGTNPGNPNGQYQFGFGNQSRNSWRGPDYTDTDMNVSKSFIIHEGVRFKFGANAFNLLNHPNFSAPKNNLATASSFGKIQADVPPVSSPYGNFQGAGVSGRILQVFGGISF